MTVGADSLVDLARRILSEDAGEREAGAENASDWSSILDQDEASTIVQLLAAIASIEQERRVREAQLHAILEISDSFAVGEELLYPLRRLKSVDWDAEQLEYLHELGIRPGVET